MAQDAFIVGGGLIGLALARELNRRGLSVAVADAAEAGAASWAGAGMLAARLTTHPALIPWVEASAAMYADWAAELERETYLSVGYRPSGTLVLGHAPRPLPQGWTPLDGKQLSEIEPALVWQDQPAYRIADDHSVDNRALHAALLASVRARGVEIRRERVACIRGDEARIVVNAAGAWAGAMATPFPVPVRPRKGQMLSLRTSVNVRHVIEAPGVYIVPRSDGRTLIGATLEDAGFDPEVSRERLDELSHRAAALVPALDGAPWQETWCGYRPCSPDELPILGESPVPGYWLATAHYRDGILLTPITAEVLADAITGVASRLSLAAFSPTRF